MADAYDMASPEQLRLLTLGAPKSRPAAPGFFDTIGLSYKQAKVAPDWGLNQAEGENKALAEVKQALRQQGVKLPLPSLGLADRSPDVRRWAADSDVAETMRLVEQVRAKDPTFLPDYAGVKDSAGLSQLVYQRRKQQSEELGVELQDAGWAPWLTGQFARGLGDPTSFIPVGGGPAGSGIVRQVLTVAGKEAAANAAIALALEPAVRIDSANMGIDRTIADTALDVTVQGLTGAVIGGAAKGVDIGGTAALDKLSPDRHVTAAAKELDATIRAATWDASRDGQFVSDILSPSKGYSQTRAAAAGTAATREAVDAFERSVPPNRRTADEQAAINVATRDAEVREASPLTDTPDGQDHHASRFDEALAAIHRGELPPDRAAPIPPPPARAIPPRGSGALPSDIVQFFRDKGATEAQARGIAAGIVAESGGDHRIVNPTSGAFGLGQHLGPRKKELFERYGPQPTRQQQLENLWRELQGGDHGGAAVLAQADEAKVLDAYIRKFMRPAAGAETSGDLRRGMAALGRGEEAIDFGDGSTPPTAEAAGSADPAAAEAAFASVRPDALGQSSIAGMIIDGQPVPMDFVRFDPRDLEVDAELMQFKHGGDAMGVTDAYSRVNRWNPGLADPVVVWESNGGRRVVADGHQRHGIARRSLERFPDHPVQMDAFVMREADGYSARDARLFAAFRNVAQGHGGPLDFAKLLAETGGLLPVGIDTAKSALRDARGIVKLEGSARALAFAEKVRADYAGMIGNLMPHDEQRQLALMQLLMEADPSNMTQAVSIVRDGIEAGFADGEQLDLFGNSRAFSKLKMRAQILDTALGELKTRKLVHSTVGKNADMIEAAGSKVNVSAAEREAQANAQAIELVARLASVAGPIKDALDAATDARALGVKRVDAARQFADAVAKIDLADIAAADRAGTGPAAGQYGDGIGAARYAGDAAARDAGPPAGHNDPAIAEAVAAADADADLQAGLFDDPAGPAAKEQAQLAGHDVEMLAADPVARIGQEKLANAPANIQEAVRRGAHMDPWADDAAHFLAGWRRDDGAMVFWSSRDQQTSINKNGSVKNYPDPTGSEYLRLARLPEDVDQPLFRMEANGDKQSAADILAAIDEDKKAAADLRACLAPKG